MRLLKPLIGFTRAQGYAEIGQRQNEDGRRVKRWGRGRGMQELKPLPMSRSDQMFPHAGEKQRIRGIG